MSLRFCFADSAMHLSLAQTGQSTPIINTSAHSSHCPYFGSFGVGQACPFDTMSSGCIRGTTCSTRISNRLDGRPSEHPFPANKTVPISYPSSYSPLARLAVFARKYVVPCYSHKSNQSPLVAVLLDPEEQEAAEEALQTRSRRA